MALKLVGLCGSLRAGSFNRALLHEGVRAFGPADLSLGDLNLPLYNGDDEARDGVPEQVTHIAATIAEADAVIIASPEYNQSVSGVMKNALDWISRAEGTPWRDKPVAIMSATAGRAGGARAQYALRLCLQPFRARVLPGPEVMVAASHKEFDENGRLKAESYQALLTELMSDLRKIAEG